MSTPVRFTAELELHGRTATGITVPDEAVEALGSGRRPAVLVTINGYTYRSTVAVMGGVNLLPVAAEHRTAAGLTAGERVEVALALDTAPRVVEVPEDLAAALAANAPAKQAFEALSYSNQNRYVLSVTGAKTAETRTRRIERTIAELGG